MGWPAWANKPDNRTCAIGEVGGGTLAAHVCIGCSKRHKNRCSELFLSAQCLDSPIVEFKIQAQARPCCPVEDFFLAESHIAFPWR